MIRVSNNCFKDVLNFIDHKNRDNIFVMEDKEIYMNEELLKKYDSDLIYRTLLHCASEDFIEIQSDNREIKFAVGCVTQKGYNFLYVLEDSVWEKIEGGIEKLSGFTLDTLKIIANYLK